MKTKCFLTAILMTVAMSVSAQVQVFTHEFGHGAICREKKLFMMEAGDRTPIWNITNYKKTGTKETFTLTPKEDARDTYTCVMTLNGDTPTEMTLTSKSEGKKSYQLKLTDDKHLNNYYGGLCGYEAKASTSSTYGSKSSASDVVSGEANAQDLEEGGVKGAAKSVGAAAKGAFGKIKGLFGKKKKKDKTENSEQ